MPRWEQMRYQPTRLCYPTGGPAAGYTLEDAVKAREEMAKIGYPKLLELLQSPGQVCKLYYPGLGLPPKRPGGDITYAARAQLGDLLRVIQEAVQTAGGVYVTGPKGIGKSCYLRALAWLLILESEAAQDGCRVICLWSMLEAYNNIVGEMVAALRFSYCLDTDVLKVIDGLQSLQAVEGFLRTRLSLGEKFYFIVDGVEALDTTTSKGVLQQQRLEAETVLQRLLAKAHISVCGVSPVAVESRKRKAGWGWVHFEQGFWKDEYETYLGRVSLLSKLDRRQDDIDYFAGVHPLSLAVLDACCRLHAKKRSRRSDGRGPPSQFKDSMKDEQIVELLQDKDEWGEVLNLFVSSGDMSSVRAQAKDTLKNLDFTSGYHSQASMMEMDTRYVYGDPPTDYVTPYITRIYIEAFRDAESRAVYKGAAWQQYCRYLIDSRNPVNWAEMGWLCENLAAEVISMKGLTLESLSIHHLRCQKFGAVPDYNSWIPEVSVGSGVYFIPFKYSSASIDALLVWRDPSGVLHLIALQVTVNHEHHLASAMEFMSFNTVTQWIPEGELGRWKRHFVFVCLKDLPAVDVEDKVKTIGRSGVKYGTVAHRLHVVSFLRALGGGVTTELLNTLKQVAQLRDRASLSDPDEAAKAEAKEIEEAVASAVVGKGSTNATAILRDIFLLKEVTKLILEKIAQKYQIPFSTSDCKATLAAKVATGIAEL